MSEGGQPSVTGPRAGEPVRYSQDFYGGVTLVALALIALGVSLRVWSADDVFGPAIVGLFTLLVGLVGAALVTGRLSVSDPHDLYGGVLLAALVLIALVISLVVKNQAVFGPVLMPRLFALLVGLAGVAVVAGLLKVRAPQDFYGGAALVALAVVAMLASNELPGQRGFAFGPGTAPRLFAVLLATLGCAIALIGIFMQGPPLESYKWRGMFFITGSILVFAACIRPLGLVIASFACIISCAAADPEDLRWRETILWAIILTAFCSILFIYGLNLPFQLWPRLWL